MTTELPTLYKKTKLGATQVWRVWTEGAEVVSEYGQLDGAMQIARFIATPKNVGRANETTAEEQAVLEAKSAWEKRKTVKRYSEDIGAISDFTIAPMLAKTIDDRMDKEVATAFLDYGFVHVQPKLDGLRCMAFWEDGKVVLFSRGGKYYDAPAHIIQYLTSVLPKNFILDGELYGHGIGFQQITSYAKRAQPGTDLLRLHVYDLIDRDVKTLNWEVRYRDLSTVSFLDKGPLERVETYEADSVEEIDALHKDFIADGYEGSIVRLPGYPYTFDKRSVGLLKYKDFMDAEFKVIGHKSGKGKFADCAVFVCELPNGGEVEVTPTGTQEQRREYLSNIDNYMGKMLTVKFFGYTDAGSLRFPVGLHFRPEEDL